MAGLAALIVCWCGMLEIDRGIEQLRYRGFALAWPAWQLKQMAWTAWWAVVLLGCVAGLRKFWKAASDRTWWTEAGWVAADLIALKFLVIDALPARWETGPAAVPAVANFQVAVATAVLAAFVALRYLGVTRESGRYLGAVAETLGKALGAVVIVVVGSLEIDRLFSARGAALFGDPWLAEQVTLSLWWSVFAVGAIAMGFAIRATWLRHLGLGLFAATLVKVGVIELSRAEYGYRILSFLALGLLLLGTSALYGKLSPRLAGNNERGKGDAGSRRQAGAAWPSPPHPG